MQTVMCVLKSGGIYTEEWVRKLRDGVARHMGEHRFVCLSDVPVPCERIALEQEWPGWWSKIELFRPGVINGPTLYLDLDTAVVGPLRDLFNLPHDFAMLANFSNPEMVGSGVMWFKRNAPAGVYEKFIRQPLAYIAHHERRAERSYIGDQAFIWDAIGDQNIARIQEDFTGIHSYKRTCRSGLPKDARLVVFPGNPKPTEIEDEWMTKAWA